jgi:hypothetical protein
VVLAQIGQHLGAQARPERTARRHAAGARATTAPRARYRRGAGARCTGSPRILRLIAVR